MPKSLQNFYAEVKLLTEAASGVSFEIEVPITRYVNDNDIPDILNFNYASRDVTWAEDRSKKMIMDRLGLPSFPISVNLIATFKKFIKQASIYKITLSGENSVFLKSVRKLFADDIKNF